MPFGTPQIFQFHCRASGTRNSACCKSCGELYRNDPVVAPHEKRSRRTILSGESLRRYTQALARMCRATPSEFIWRAVAEKLALAPRMLTDKLPL